MRGLLKLDAELNSITVSTLLLLRHDKLVVQTLETHFVYAGSRFDSEMTAMNF